MVENGYVVLVVISVGVLVDGFYVLGVKWVVVIVFYMKLLIWLVVFYIENEGIVVQDWLVLEILDNLEVVVQDLVNLLEYYKCFDLLGIDVLVFLVCVQMLLLFLIQWVEDVVGLFVVLVVVCIMYQMLVWFGFEMWVFGVGVFFLGRF